jgi:nucleoside-diphosphate-sugar epimerase
MRVLVTGSSGHVGGAIASHLISSGWDVIGLSRTPNYIQNLNQSLQIDLGSKTLAEQISVQTSRCDAIVHAAASLDKRLYTSDICLTNCLGTQQILKLADFWQVEIFIYVSSVPIIGKPKVRPITEDHPIDPPTAYHASKLFGEYLTLLANRNGLTGSILRLTSPIGPGMPDNRILSVFTRRALANQPLQLSGQGTRQQNYVDVRDVSIAVENCLRKHVAGLFNIAGKCSISNLELAQVCINELASSSEIEFTGQSDPEEAINWDVSILKAISYLDYCPQYEIRHSIHALRTKYEASSN